MKYVSTRGQSPALDFTNTLLAGLAPDGGLYIPEEYPRFSQEELETSFIQLASGKPEMKSYAYLAFVILSRFAPEIPRDVLRRICFDTYRGEVFKYGRDPSRSSEITPLHELEQGLYLLELSNGPTLAFKDIALQLLGNLFEWALEQQDKTLNILAATSGDTGSAAEYALRGKSRIRVFMLSPHGKGMSPFQAAQMYSLPDSNIVNLAINGVFDDAQDVVKAVSGDAEFKAQYNIGAVNSINWARIAAQVVYYFAAYFQLVERGVVKQVGDPVDFSVPTGNFGDILAGHVAREMGLPIGRLILAANENNVLDEFFRTGIYRPRTGTHITSSPSMDISKASNFERFIADLVLRDGDKVSELFGSGNYFDLSDSDFFSTYLPRRYPMVSGWNNHSVRIASIREVYKHFGIIIDPHTADAYMIGVHYRRPDVPLVILETAQAAKFEATVEEALKRKPDRHPDFLGIENLPQRVRVIDPDPELVKRIIAETCGR